MEKEHAVSFLKHHSVVTGAATVSFDSEIEYTVVAGRDEKSMIQVLTFCKNGLIVLANSETKEFWSNYKPVLSNKDGQTVISFEIE